MPLVNARAANFSVARMAAGGRCLEFRARWAAAIAHAGMKPIRQWNAPLGLVQVLVFGGLITGFTFAWMSYAIPYLSSLLASQKRFAENYPFLYDVAHTAVAFTLLPLMGGFAFIVLYFYQRSYDRRQQRHADRAA
jgi:TRAP-type C4-dicarboxylate transport system permease small subunit